MSQTKNNVPVENNVKLFASSLPSSESAVITSATNNLTHPGSFFKNVILKINRFFSRLKCSTTFWLDQVRLEFSSLSKDKTFIFAIVALVLIYVSWFLLTLLGNYLDANEEYILGNFDSMQFEEKTRRALQEPTGQAITSAISKDCPLTINDETHKTQLLGLHNHIKVKCPRSDEVYPTTFWRLETRDHFLTPFQLSISNSSLLCLATANYSNFLTVDFCNGTSREQLFTLYMEKISMKTSRVYFSIRSEEREGNCVELHEDAKLGNVFLVEWCSKRDNQLFYLNGVDYEKELYWYLKSKLRPCYIW